MADFWGKLRDFASGLSSPEEDEKDASTGFTPVDRYVEQKKTREAAPKVETDFDRSLARIGDRVNSVLQPALRFLGETADATVKGGARFAVSAAAAPFEIARNAESAPEPIRKLGRVVSDALAEFDMPVYGTQRTYQEAVRRGGSVGAAAIDAALDEPIGVAVKPLFAFGGLLLKKGAKRVSEMVGSSAVRDIAKADSPVEIRRLLDGKIAKDADPREVNELASRLAGIKDEADVAFELDLFGPRAPVPRVNGMGIGGPNRALFDELADAAEGRLARGVRVVDDQGRGGIVRSYDAESGLGDVDWDWTRKGLTKAADSTITPASRVVIADTLENAARAGRVAEPPREFGAAPQKGPRKVSAKKDWSSNYADRAMELDRKSTELAAQAKEARGANKKRLLDEKAKVDAQAAALEDEFIEKHRGNARADGAAPAPAPRTPDVPPAPPAAAVDQALPEGPLTPSKLGQRVAADASKPRAYRDYARKIELGTVTNKDLVEKAKLIRRQGGAPLADILAKDGDLSMVEMEVIRQHIDDVLAPAYRAAATEAEKSAVADQMTQLVDRAARNVRTLGQGVQAARLWAQVTTPSGVVSKVRRAISKLKGAPKSNAEKVAARSQDEWLERARKIEEMPPGDAKTVEALRLQGDMDRALTPPSLWRKLSSYQTMAMLLNVKTILRNVIGNSLFAVQEYVKSVPAAAFDAVWTTAQRAAGRKDVARSVKFVDPFTYAGRYAESFRKGLAQGIEDARLGVSYDNFTGKWELPNTQMFKDKTVSRALQRWLDYGLKATDRAYYQAAHDASLFSQMKAAKVATPTDEMLDEAHLDGLYQTFQNDSWVSKGLTSVKGGLNEATTGTREFGLGDIVMKFARTPGNLLVSGLHYTPAGFIKVAFELARAARGTGSAKQVADAFGRAAAGTAGLFGIGYRLGELGIITPPSDSSGDRDRAAAYDSAGIRPNSVNVSALRRYVASAFDRQAAAAKDGDTFVSYEWLQPAAISVALGAAMAKDPGDARVTLDRVANATADTLDFLVEAPTFTGLRKLFGTGSFGEKLGQAVMGVPSSFVPTLVNQVRQTVDPVRRDRYDESTVVRYGVNPILDRLPFASETLNPRMDALGNEMRYGPEGQPALVGAANAFFSPWIATRADLPDDAKMVFRLAKATGDDTVFPRLQRTSITVNGESKKLTDEEYAAIQRYAGFLNKRFLAQVSVDPRFAAMSPQAKIDYLTAAYDDIGKAAKMYSLGDRPAAPAKDALVILQQTIPPDAYRQILREIGGAKRAAAEEKRAGR